MPAPAFDTRVADFGMSLVRKALPVPAKDAGWLPWLSPEQVDGSEPAGPAADVFTLALVAFFAATGKTSGLCDSRMRGTPLTKVE